MILDIYEKCNAEEGCRERWNRWEHHRDHMNEVLKEQVFSKSKIKDVLVLGAGRCEDIDLKLLLAHAETLTLADYDLESMENAVKKQGLNQEDMKRVLLKGGIEFTGFYTEGFLNKITSMIREKAEASEITELILKQLAESDGELAAQLQRKGYSLIVSGAVHSQLIVPYTQLAAIDMVYWETFMEHVVHIADTFSENLNMSTLSLLKEGGFLFSYFDVIELSERNGTLPLETVINGLITEGRTEAIDELLMEYGGVAGARYGYEHLNVIANRFKPYEKTWIWNFRDNKKYYVKSLCFQRV